MADFEKTIKWLGIKDPGLAKKLEKPWEENGELIYPPNKTWEIMQKRYETIAQDKNYTSRESSLDEMAKNILPLIKNKTYIEKIFIPVSGEKTRKKFIVDAKTNNVLGANYQKGKYTITEYFNVFDKKLKKYVNIKAFLTNNTEDGGYNIATVSIMDAATNEILEFRDEQKFRQTNEYLIT